MVLLKRPARFADLRAAMPPITDRMLSERLHELEQEGIVTRTVIPATPVRVEYALTDKGRALGSVTDAVSAWAHRWTEGEPVASGDAPVETAQDAPRAAASATSRRSVARARR